MHTKIISLLTFCCVPLLELGLLSAHAAAIQPPPVQAFFSYAQISDVQISPDGTYLAMVVADSQTGIGRKSVEIYSLKAHDITAKFHTVENQVVANFWWANNTRLLVTTAQPQGSLAQPRGDGDLFGVNVDGTNMQMLMGAQVSGTHGSSPETVHNDFLFFDGLIYEPNDSNIAIVQTPYDNNGNVVAQAYRINIDSGYYAKVAAAPYTGLGLVADQSGEIRLACGNDSRLGIYACYYRSDAHSLDWKRLAVTPEDDDFDTGNGVVGFTPDNKNIYLLAPTPSTTQGLYSLNPDTLKTQLLFGDPHDDIYRLIWSFDLQKTQRIIGVWTMPGGYDLHILDPHSRKALDLVSLLNHFAGQMVTITSNTHDGSLMVVRVSSDRNPGSFYLYNSKTHQVTFLFDSLPAIKPQDMASMRPIEFKARDGVTLHGYLTLPLGGDGRSLPLIVNPHGGPVGVQDALSWNPEAQYFASHGYAWLQVNYRGSAGYGLQFQKLGYRHWGSTMQSDLADAVHWAVSQGIADPKRICIYGGSYGGYAALENSILYPTLYRCTVGYAGVYDLSTMYGANFKYAVQRSKYLRNYLNAVLGDESATLQAESPVYQADKIEDPVLIVYGGADPVASPKNSQELIAALRKAGKQYTVMYKPHEGHGFFKPQNRFELYTHMLAFFDKYIGPDAVVH